MRHPACAVLAVAVFLLPAVVQAADPPAAGAAARKPKYDENSTFGELIRDPAAKAVLERTWPVIIEAVELGGVPPERTLKEASQAESARTKGGLTDEIYARMLSELGKL